MQNVNEYATATGRAVAILVNFEKTPNLLTQRPSNALYIVVSDGLVVAGTPNLHLTHSYELHPKSWTQRMKYETEDRKGVG